MIMTPEQLPAAELTAQSEAAYALAALRQFYARTQLFVAIGDYNDFPADASFEDYEAMSEDYLTAFGSWINEKQFVNATWRDTSGSVTSGGFIGLKHELDKEHGLALELQVVANHDFLAGVQNITADRLLTLAPSGQGQPQVVFMFKKKTPPAPLGGRTQAIIDHFIAPERVQFRPSRPR